MFDVRTIAYLIHKAYSSNSYRCNPRTTYKWKSSRCSSLKPKVKVKYFSDADQMKVELLIEDRKRKEQ